MPIDPDSARARAMTDTRNRILDVALDVLGRDPDAGMGDIATAAEVVRRTVYGYFPTRADLVRTLAQRAVDDLFAVLTDVVESRRDADEAWVDFIGRLWPLARRYRVLVALRRGEYGREIHALLGPFDTKLTELVERGQQSGVFGRHLPAPLLSEVAYATVFTIADDRSSAEIPDARAAAVTSLLLLGVPQPRAELLVADLR